jgi:hypothetical protein
MLTLCSRFLYSLENMSGSFNGTILSQINATSSVAPSGAGATLAGTASSTGLAGGSTVSPQSGGTANATGSVIGAGFNVTSSAAAGKSALETMVSE